MEEKYISKEALTNRLLNLVMIKNSVKTESFPKSFVMLGFGSLHIDDENELKIRIKELSEILKIELEELENGRFIN